MMQYEKPEDWVLATGETYTVRDFLEATFKKLELDWEDFVETSERYFRPNEVDYLLGDPTKAKEKLGWEAKTSFDQMVDLMIESDLNLARREEILLKEGLIKATWETHS